MIEEISTSIIIFLIVIGLLKYIDKGFVKDNLRSSELTKDEYNQLYELLKNADTLYNQRINFFLVAESMFVISFVTALTNSFINKEIGQGISVIGLIFTSIWLYTNARSGERVVYLIRKYLKKDTLYKDYITSVGGSFSKPLLTYGLSIFLNLLWVFFLCLSININPWIWIIELFLVMILISIWLNWFHIPEYH